jgi:spore maturation protein CgeB
VVHYAGWDEGDWRGLDKVLVSLLADEGRRARLAYKGQEWVRKHHTYSHRVNLLIDALRLRGLLSE